MLLVCMLSIDVFWLPHAICRIVHLEFLFILVNVQQQSVFFLWAGPFSAALCKDLIQLLYSPLGTENYQNCYTNHNVSFPLSVHCVHIALSLHANHFCAPYTLSLTNGLPEIQKCVTAVGNMAMEVKSVELDRQTTASNPNGTFGFSVLGGSGTKFPAVVCEIDAGGPADLCGKARVTYIRNFEY